MASTVSRTTSRPERELVPGQSEKLLRELHLVSRDGKLHADSLRKLKQVNHLARLLTPALDDVLARHPQAQILDAGAGNAYLGFVLYELFLREGEATMWNIEPRADLVARGEQRAQSLAYARMRFVGETLEQAAANEPAPPAAPSAAVEPSGVAQTASGATAPLKDEEPKAKVVLPTRLHLVTALHACDTATDDALLLALRRKADHVALVPCCQAEVAAQLKELAAKNSGPAPFDALWQHALHRREFGAHLTNVIRALVLEASGYAVTVTELTGWEHSLKNELILARRVGGEHRGAKEKLRALLAATGVKPKIARALQLTGPDAA